MGIFSRILCELSSKFSIIKDEEKTAKNILSRPIDVSKTYGVNLALSTGSKYLICFVEYFSWLDKSKSVLEWIPSSSLKPKGKLNSMSHAASA